MNKNMNKERQTDEAVSVIVFAVTLVGALLLTTSASAQTTRLDQSDPFTATVANPCVPEDVPVEGFIRIKEATHVQPNGTVQFRANDTISATGVGAVTGVNYTYRDNLMINIIFDPDGGPIIVRTRAKVLSDGPVDNFFVTAVFKVSGDGQKSTTTFGENCR
jgi:hypothetical protein